ncbi:trifunctional transcriptional regulator/proline dehydrogenase/L-glutamate gamma-semialdehyde dehydrogenase [Orrella marina]|uniref:Bifunctional protein PutA n=1 Tax=Orrella marina TaxID=2163011 RepID=A0A2R4XIL5_9BURK|nr:trifunctional transcriptional regulator/proline dehydrogenase/L-glutamate gamma-semialdehyde dehydrogenase [Orrella marina]AWB33593.1 trifunctional transcriptional regulator/proline dehydrogenase/L-glutamate gamma-semialdehyde dehydrogenase [Orrella marina]
MSTTTTLGVKVDNAIRDRLKRASERLGCTPHWLHKQALIAYIEAIEKGQLPAEISFLSSTDPDSTDDVGNAESYSPFYEFAQDILPQSVLRSCITSAYRRPETEQIPMLLSLARSSHPREVNTLATRLVQDLRAKPSTGGVEGLIQEFSLSSQEGIALMCLAEALLRIPDRATRDALIRDKISRGDWRSHMGESSSLFVNAATWGLMLTGKLVGVSSERNLSHALTRLIGKGGEPLIRKGVNVAMRMMGEQFVSGQTIASALANGRKFEAKGFRYSYDMLGEAATTADDAQRYFLSYQQAIHAIGKAAQGRGIYEGPGISIKLSALHPRYCRAQRERMMQELLPRLLVLARQARQYDIGLNIDAEEADRLELSLDLLEALCFDEELNRWNGIGFVVQAYQKRAPFVIDYLVDLAKRSNHRIMIRLVKGAYWDTEIKRAQIDGLEGYPVYTRKVYTDMSYLACARKLLASPQYVYPQFATHNAQTLSAIYYMAGNNYYPGQYEFQCLHGMGEPLYELVTGPVSQGKLNRPCRIYAPVGSHETLLPYLVRRLLENGANTSFVNLIGNEEISVSSLVADPVAVAEKIVPIGSPHDKIPLPRDLYCISGRRNSIGLDLSNEQRLASLSGSLLNSTSLEWRAMPMIDEMQTTWNPADARPVHNPADHRDIVGHVMDTDPDLIPKAIEQALNAFGIWASTPVQERAECLSRAAQILEDEMQTLIGLIVREAGKSLPNAIGEVREAVDFLRYYSNQIKDGFSNDTHRPLGPVVCISPWNFPLAIFTGQVSAALAAGNTVLAKPAEQTSLVAAAAVNALRRAGIPEGAIQLLPGRGETVGSALVSDPAVRAVMFTGSTEVARVIAASLAERLDNEGHTIPLIAETGGQNAMIVDSSALCEQVIQDVLASAFDSAGQRCSALRVLCVQNDCADHVISMLRDSMRELSIDRPDKLSTDVGPVIDAEAQRAIQSHIVRMRESGKRVDQIDLGPATRHGTFIAPTLIEISQISELGREVFGPVLHVLRYRREQLNELIDAINATGYGLTFGIHTRLDETIAQVSERIRVGNIYVNRNIVGAVVGVQPFGGEGLSGTGPKAGGPLYLRRLLATQPDEMPESIESALAAKAPVILEGPTGESNTYLLKPRGQVICKAVSIKGIQAQQDICVQTGNRMLLIDTPVAREFVKQMVDQKAPSSGAFCELVSHEDWMNQSFEAALFEGDGDALIAFNQVLTQRNGPIVLAQGLSSDEIEAGMHYRPEPLLREVSISVNTAAAGGNASLMMIG